LDYVAEFIGLLAATITTLAWVPQILKILRHRRTADISIGTNLALASGIVLWFIYGVYLWAWPVMLANGISFLFIATILALKLRYG
jgi:MtN3 and saliva related transmembrane protein